MNAILLYVVIVVALGKTNQDLVGRHGKKHVWPEKWYT